MRSEKKVGMVPELIISIQMAHHIFMLARNHLLINQSINQCWSAWSIIWREVSVAVFIQQMDEHKNLCDAFSIDLDVNERV